MKIVYLQKLKDLSEELGEYFGIKTEKIPDGIEDPRQSRDKTEKKQNDESVIFVGSGLANKYLKNLKKKCNLKHI